MVVEPGKFLTDKNQIKIDKEGGWFYNNLPIINKNIYLFFNRHIKKSRDGGYVLKIGNETWKLIVEDTPYVVVNIDFVSSPREAEAFFKIRLNDETEETLDLSTFYIGKSSVPYCMVKRRKFKARFLRNPYYHLAQYIHQEKEDTFYILLNNRKIYIKSASE